MRSSQQLPVRISPGRMLLIALASVGLLITSQDLIGRTGALQDHPTDPTSAASDTQDEGWLPTDPHRMDDPETVEPADALQTKHVLTMPPSTPVRVRVDAIGVDATLLDLGVKADGSLEVPPGAPLPGWFTGGPTPGSLGPAVIVGHVDWGGHAGVFVDLKRVSVGDEIVVDREDGSSAIFRVTYTTQIAKQAFPTSLVYGNLDHAGLRLITCGGAFDPTTRSYADNVIVYAELVASA